MKHPVEQEMQLIEDISSFAYDPYGYVMYNYPWGEPNKPLADSLGPRKWQAELLKKIGEHVRQQQFALANDLVLKTFQACRASGRGIGKSALFSMLTGWMLDCHIGSSVMLVANTEAQLRTTTFLQMGKWFAAGLTADWWNTDGFKIYPQTWLANMVHDQLKIDPEQWGAFGKNWSEENPDAFVGMHNPLGLAAFFDEASNIPSPIWTVTGGCFTENTPFAVWMAFSNPRRNSGAFYDRFYEPRFAKYWDCEKIDARTVEGMNTAKHLELIDTHGAHSDEARVEVYGEFPEAGDNQFIPNSVVHEAQIRELAYHDDTRALILGVDPAPRGRTVLRARQGRDARSIPPIVLQGVDNIGIVNRIVDFCNKYDPDAIAIDAGNGHGVIDLCREKKIRVHEVNFGSKAEDQDGEFGLVGAELWGKMRDWLPGGAIDDSKELKRDLTVRTWQWFGREDSKKMLTPKKQMARDGIPSPDDGDALALTFYPKVVRRSKRTRTAMGAYSSSAPVARDADYDIFGA